MQKQIKLFEEFEGNVDHSHTYYVYRKCPVCKTMILINNLNLGDETECKDCASFIRLAYDLKFKSI